MKNIKKILLSLSLFSLFSLALAVTVEVPGGSWTARDTNVPVGWNIEGDADSIINLIQQINTYLWFSIGAVCLFVSLYAGYSVIMAQGDKGKMKKANELLTGALVGLFIAIFSYVIVRLVVNLF